MYNIPTSRRDFFCVDPSDPGGLRCYGTSGKEVLDSLGFQFEVISGDYDWPLAIGVITGIGVVGKVTPLFMAKALGRESHLTRGLSVCAQIVYVALFSMNVSKSAALGLPVQLAQASAPSRIESEKSERRSDSPTRRRSDSPSLAGRLRARLVSQGTDMRAADEMVTKPHAARHTTPHHTTPQHTTPHNTTPHHTTQQLTRCVTLSYIAPPSSFSLPHAYHPLLFYSTPPWPLLHCTTSHRLSMQPKSSFAKKAGTVFTFRDCSYTVYVRRLKENKVSYVCRVPPHIPW